MSLIAAVEQMLDTGAWTLEEVDRAFLTVSQTEAEITGHVDGIKRRDGHAANPKLASRLSGLERWQDAWGRKGGLPPNGPSGPANTLFLGSTRLLSDGWYVVAVYDHELDELVGSHCWHPAGPKIAWKPAKRVRQPV